jgi:uncharacterized metal-binding protein
MTSGARRVCIVPCSGIGKPFGTVSREAAYEVVEELRPHSAELVALALLVLGDESARDAVRTQATVTIDGCKLMCAAKVVAQNGGRIAREFAVLDAFRERPDLKPEGVAELNAAGQQLARVLAEKVAATVDEATRAGEGERA